MVTMASYTVTPFKRPSSKIVGDDKCKNLSSVKRKISIDDMPVNVKPSIKRKRNNNSGFPHGNDLAEYVRNYSKISESITFRYNKIVLVWCPLASVKPDFVATIVHEYGETEYKIDRWVVSPLNASVKDWSGMIIKYTHERDAMKAAEDLPLRSPCLKTMKLLQLVNHLSSAEASHPEFEKTSSEIRVSFDSFFDDEARVHLFLREFKCYAIFLNNQNVEPFGILSVSVKKSCFQEEVITSVKENLIDHIENLCLSI